MARATPITPPPLGAIPIGDRKVQLGAPMGQGSMATVYRATLGSAHGVRRTVACKLFAVFPTDEHDAAVETLKRAVQRAACIRHANVAATYEFGLIGPQAYILSELVEGTSLGAFVQTLALRSRRMPLDLGMFIATEIAEGLTAARSARNHDGLKLGMTHADLSSRDVLLSWGGDVKVTDFAIGAARHAASSVRSLAKLARRADTMSPEVARGADGDARSDVFSLGVVMRQMLSGPRFLRDVSDADGLRYAREGFVQPITFEPHLPDEVRVIISRALEIDPERRFPHSGAMAYDLRRVALGLGVGDARVFLRSMLEKEVGGERSDVTLQGAPMTLRSPPPQAWQPASRVTRLRPNRGEGE